MYNDRLNWLLENKIRVDALELVLDNKKDRNLKDILFYEIKGRFYNTKRKYYETCHSNYLFVQEAFKKGFTTYIVALMIFPNWRFSFNVHEYDKVTMKVYDSRNNKIIKFT